MIVRLRPYKSMDEDFLIRCAGDEESLALWGAGYFRYPLTKEQLNLYKERYENEPEGFLMTAIDEKGIPVGHIRMEKPDWEESSIWFGNIMVDSSRRGTGLGTKMLETAFTYAFEVLKVSKVILGVFDNNLPAQKCYRRLGFVENGRSEEYRIFREEVWRRREMELSKQQLENRQEA